MQPLFIGGTGRCGTTVLKRALALHPRVFALRDEFRVLVDPGGALDLVSALSDRWSPYHADDALRRFRELWRACARSGHPLAVFAQKAEKNLFRRLGAAPRRYLGLAFGGTFGRHELRRRLDALERELCHHVSRGSWIGTPAALRGRLRDAGPFVRADAERKLRGFVLDLISHAAGADRTCWVEDTPTNLVHADELARLFPGSRIVHIHRDPRDVLASYLGFSWGGDEPVAVARRLAGIYRRWAEVRERVPAGSYFEIALEDLAADPRTHLARICAFAGLDFDPRILEQPFDQVHAGRWKTDLAISTVRAVEEVLGDLPR